jgi:RNA polymerase sigma factor (sigma-70 family)
LPRVSTRAPEATRSCRIRLKVGRWSRPIFRRCSISRGSRDGRAFRGRAGALARGSTCLAVYSKCGDVLFPTGSWVAESTDRVTGTGPETATDLDLVRLAQAGDVEAFGELVERNRRAVFRAALAAVRSPAEADDVAQEAFVTAFRKLQSFRGESQFRTWLLSITWRKAIDRRKSMSRWLRLSAPDAARRGSRAPARSGRADTLARTLAGGRARGRRPAAGVTAADRHAAEEAARRAAAGWHAENTRTSRSASCSACRSARSNGASPRRGAS